VRLEADNFRKVTISHRTATVDCRTATGLPRGTRGSPTKAH
jgi:hypothetical protein